VCYWLDRFIALCVLLYTQRACYVSMECSSCHLLLLRCACAPAGDKLHLLHVVPCLPLGIPVTGSDFLMHPGEARGGVHVLHVLVCSSTSVRLRTCAAMRQFSKEAHSTAIKPSETLLRRGAFVCAWACSYLACCH
jgi:hypothetical protein